MKSEWLIINIDGARAQFARCASGDPISIHGERSYESSRFSTATDALLQYGQDEKLSLRGLPTVLVVSGPIFGDTIRIARCPWIISLRGIGYIVDSEPLALNDSAAKAWANLQAGVHSHVQVGGAPDARPPHSAGNAGCYLAVNVGFGVGATILLNRPPHRSHLETEVGHADFAPSGPVERALYDALARQHKAVSWEQALVAPPAGPAWATTPLAANGGAIAKARAEMIGNFCGNAVLSTGTWAGLLLHGDQGILAARPDLAAAFNARFEARAGQSALVRRIPRWVVLIRDENLIGAARFLQNRMQSRDA